MRTVSIPERWEQIIKFVQARGIAEVSDIAHELDVSVVTVRRDLTRIEQRGLIRRTHGGARAADGVNVGQTLIDSLQTNAIEKLHIGRCAAQLVKAGDSIMIDGGATALQVARHLDRPNVTVVTTSLDIVRELSLRPDIRLVVIGGEVSSDSATTTGPSAKEQILGLSANKAILGADAIWPGQGLSAPNALTAENKKAMVLRCREVIVVADHTKLGRTALYRVAHPEKITTLVTDWRTPPEMVDAFRSSGVRVIIASAGG